MDLLKKSIEILDKVNAKDITVFDFEKTSAHYDYFIIGTVNDRAGQAAAQYFGAELRSEIRHVEGKGNAGWILIDLGDIVVHLFKEEERKFYGFDQRFMEFRK